MWKNSWPSAAWRSLTKPFAREPQKVGGQKALAAILGISTSFLGDVIGNRRHPTDTIAAALGLTKKVVFVKTTKSGGRS
jgi:putative effector of murein hydrolase